MEQKTISLVARAHRRRLLEAMASSVDDLHGNLQLLQQAIYDRLSVQ
jgi:hypothetical protein